MKKSDQKNVVLQALNGYLRDKESLKDKGLSLEIYQKLPADLQAYMADEIFSGLQVELDEYDLADFAKDNNLRKKCINRIITSVKEDCKDHTYKIPAWDNLIAAYYEGWEAFLAYFGADAIWKEERYVTRSLEGIKDTYTSRQKAVVAKFFLDHARKESKKKYVQIADWVLRGYLLSVSAQKVLLKEIASLPVSNFASRGEKTQERYESCRDVYFSCLAHALKDVTCVSYCIDVVLNSRLAKTDSYHWVKLVPLATYEQKKRIVSMVLRSKIATDDVIRGIMKNVPGELGNKIEPLIKVKEPKKAGYDLLSYLNSASIA
ncbi:MAG: hypothetical protein WCJ81_03090 [bacterium]